MCIIAERPYQRAWYVSSFLSVCEAILLQICRVRQVVGGQNLCAADILHEQPHEKCEGVCKTDTHARLGLKPRNRITGRK
jgi:hypothetical protein